VRIAAKCSKDATAKVAITVPATTGRKLGLKGRATTVAAATARCTAGTGVTVRLKPAKQTVARIARLRKPVAATLAVTLSATGATSGGAKVAVRLG
jgi:hypothetical protein